MRLTHTLTCCALLVSVASVSASAQSRGGPSSSSRSSAAVVPVDDIGTVAKAILKDIKPVKPQSDTLKVLEKAYKDEEKRAREQLKKLVVPVANQNARMQLILDQFVADVRKVMTEQQVAKFDSNLVAYKAKVQEKIAKAMQNRGRGRGEE